MIFFIVKVFLRELLDKYFEQQRKCIVFKAAIIIQRNLRMFIQRRNYHQIRSSVILIQYYVRKWLNK